MRSVAFFLRLFAASVATRAIRVGAMFEKSSLKSQFGVSGAAAKSDKIVRPCYPSANAGVSDSLAFLDGTVFFTHRIKDYKFSPAKIDSPNKYHSISSAKRKRRSILPHLQSSSSNNGFEGFGGDESRARDYNVNPKSPFGSVRNPNGTSRNNEAFVRQQISKIFGSDNATGSRFVPLSLAGRWTQTPNNLQDKGSSNQRSVDVLFLSLPEKCRAICKNYQDFLTTNFNQDNYEKNNFGDSPSIQALPLPLSTSTSSLSIRLLSHAYASKPLSKSTILSLNTLFLRRDGGLFDNIPWSTWSIDPDKKERDAADNLIEGKYTLGKRVAYQRLMGKDWEGRSLSLGNMAKRIRYLLESEEKDDDENFDDVFDDFEMSAGKQTSEEDMMLSLSQRLLELEIKEAQMEVAACEQQVAISRAAQSSDETDSMIDLDLDNISGNEDIKSLENAKMRLQSAELSLRELTSAIQQKSRDSASSSESFSFPFAENQGKTSNLLFAILDKMAEQKNPPPYRGAIGYPAKLDTKEEMFEKSVLPYTSPYELLVDIIDEQLNSEVIGCVLEQSSLFEDNLVLGGALLLQRKGITKSVTIAGEAVSYTDDDYDYGNEGVLPQSTYVVECYSDEAIGIAVASNLPVYVEQKTWERAGRVSVELDPSVATQAKKGANASENRVNVMNRIPFMKPVDGFEFAVQVEGEKISSEQESNMIRIPLTTSPRLFDGSDLPQSSTTNPNRSVFSTFNPVRSLDEYDSLSDDEKARILLKLESFQGELPRPRAVRASMRNRSDKGYEYEAPPSLLDDILVPLIDESVRRQFLIRDAERRKDYKEANALRESSSPRQKALEEAQLAREEGREDDALKFEEEAELYKNLRADITQDEGAYSRFLDRDDWYERETQARIKRLDKSKFGSLLDGID